MKLTLRTLLAWRDRVLPEQDHLELDQKVAAAEPAQKLEQKIRDVLDRTELPAARVDGRGLAASGNKRGRAFCGDCGTSVYVWNEARPGMRAVRIGSLDDASFVKPWAHVWVSRALASTNLEDDLEKFEQQAP